MMSAIALVPLLQTATSAKRRMAAEQDPFEAMLARYARAAELLQLEPGIDRILRHPEKEIVVAVPVQMDNGEIHVFTGYRVLHNTSRGPAKGGIRFDIGVGAEEVEGTGGMDDVEVCGRRHSVRRREGRRSLRSFTLSPRSSSDSRGGTPPRSSTRSARTPTCHAGRQHE